MTKKTRTRAEAKRVMWEYYRENKEWLPKSIQRFREEILRRLIAGESDEVVFARVLNTVD